MTHEQYIERYSKALDALKALLSQDDEYFVTSTPAILEDAIILISIAKSYREERATKKDD